MKFPTRRRLFTSRRILKLLILIVCVSMIYLSFQLLSIRVLSNHAKKEDEFRKIADEINSVDVDWKMPEKKKYQKDENWPGDPVRGGIDGVPHKSSGVIIIKQTQRQTKRQMDKTKIQELSEKGVADQLQNNLAHKTKDLIQTPQGLGRGEMNTKNYQQSLEHKSVFIRGVLPKDQHLYTALPGNVFQCIHSKEKISYDFFNDDYCDCSDGSDEPSTSACSNSKFYCTFQLADMEPVSVTASKVNDGICDCCDGSDEWAGKTLDKDLKKDAQKHYSIYQAPCVDHCDDLRKLKQKQDAIKLMGARLKATYLQSANEHGKAADPVFGPQGVFFKLSLECFHYSAPHFDYTICPFKSAKQRERESTHSDVTIARGMVHWLSSQQGQYRIEMKDGDGFACPGGMRRSLVIDFSCGLDNIIQSVSESELCKYAAKFTTPAAC
ncbi:glucosidase 2 subunit beta [Lingula anatina]|uniref:Glucosidase 2 subunit beta n=1 Tax=Lingula anatina TaxID=7574 RepID=A0A1S3HXM3_LINAN|nr:glucosidase 2 subunit beta [Lingula anatina]XP_013390310.1 glucosidase 2 subunit beta [Lingula anatina]XP_013390311.1 glucosidase 2 subunit beta [Lingula anatina]XP_013390312.1 glucosidase 2 subunit beta [Lingula anatina]|eukprot:XP_013390308.1 glucosidase 2 subunit beta [Lingula anatina]